MLRVSGKFPFVVVFFLSTITFAEQWKYIGPDGGAIHHLVQDSNNGLWFSVAGVKNTLYRSTDNGRSWRSTGITDVVDFSVHPKTSQLFVGRTIRAFTYQSDILVSSNHGNSFQRLAKFSPTRIEKLAIDPNNPARLIVVIDREIQQQLITSDAGLTWKPFRRMPFAIGSKYPGYRYCRVEENWFHDFRVMPFNSDIVYATASVLLRCDPRGEQNVVSFLARSTNGGLDWTFIKDGYFLFHNNPMFRDRIYAYKLRSPGLFEVTQKGIAPLSNIQINLLTEISSDPNHLLAYGETGFLRSNDGGKIWSRLSLDPIQQKIAVLRSTNFQDNEILAGTSEGGIFRSKDLQRWVRLNNGLHELPVAKLAMGGTPPIIYALTHGTFNWRRPNSFLFRKTHGEQTWTSLVTRLPDDTSIRSLAVHPIDGKRLLVIPEDDEEFGVYLTSLNGGMTWKKHSLGQTNRNIESAVWHPQQKDIAYLLDNSGVFTLWKTTDAATTFTKIEVPQIEYGYDVRMIFQPQNPNTFYLLHSYGVLKSIDAGQTFQVLNASLKFAVDMVLLPQPSSFLVLTAYGHVYRTTNDGKTLQKISQIGRFCDRMYAASPAGKHFFATRRHPHTNINLLSESKDGGITWNDISSDVDPSGVFDLLFPGDSILAGTYHGVMEK